MDLSRRWHEPENRECKAHDCECSQRRTIASMAPGWDGRNGGLWGGHG